MNDLEKRFWTSEMHSRAGSDYYKDRVVTEFRYSEIEIDGCCHDATTNINIFLSIKKESQVEGDKDTPRAVCFSYAEDEIEYLVARALEFDRTN